MELAAPGTDDDDGGDGHPGPGPVRVRPSPAGGESSPLRSERSPNVSDCSDPISIIIVVAAVVVVVIQFWLGKTDAIIEKKRNGFTDLLQFDSDGRASEPHLSAFGDGGLTGVGGRLGGKVAET